MKSVTSFIGICLEAKATLRPFDTSIIKTFGVLDKSARTSV